MQLPQYDNRPGPGEPLYHDTPDHSGLKIAMRVLAIIALFTVCGALLFYRLFN